MKGINFVTLLGLLVLILPSVSSKILQITQSPKADTLFDRIFNLKTETGLYYLRIYCKEKNLVSVSVTKQLEFQEYPRFSISSQHSDTPRMQKKLYTFFETCKISANVQKNGKFLELKRQGTNEVIFTINSFNFIGEDIEIETEDDSTKWGMGERFQNKFAIKDGAWTVWNRDRPWEIDNGINGKSAQTYGHQPVYLARETITKKFHLIYFKNTYGFNLIAGQNTKSMKYMVTGGHIQFLIMTGENPQSILKHYHSFIGAAAVPPFWSLGYQQSRWGYTKFQDFVNVVDEFQRSKLPLDVMWSDLDYMDKKAIFTVDILNYPPAKMRDLIERRGIHYVPLIDAGISIVDQNATVMGKQMGVFFKSVKNPSQDYLATVWPGKVNFVDFLHPNANRYWQRQLERLYDLIPFSGVWLDMNEPSNFDGNQHIVQRYRIQYQESINMMTIDSNLNHYCPTRKVIKHKQVHAYYGHSITIPTYDFLKKKHGRPFIISRSNSVGTGVYAGHWTGDNVANWEFLRLSISGNFLFQIFGIQMVGADICGFHGNTTEQLCSRWMQVGSFYPFARNHNEQKYREQQPYTFGSTLLETTRLSFYQRYSLLKQMYSTLLEINGTGSFYRPLFFEFPEDEKSYLQKFAETQFLIGDYLLGAPIVQKGKNERQVYFPTGSTPQSWVQLETNPTIGATITKVVRFQGGSTIVIPNTLPSPPPTFLRSGKLIFVTPPAMRSAQLIPNFRIVAVLNNNSADGQISALSNYSDNKQIDNCVQKGCEMKIRIVRNEQGLVLLWKLKGKSSLKFEIVIDQIRVIVDENINISGQKITIASTEGQQKIIF